MVSKNNSSHPKIVPYLDEGGFAPAGQLYSSVEDIARLISLQFLDQEDNDLSFAKVGGGGGGSSYNGGSSCGSFSKNILAGDRFII